ncbi:MAG: zinc metallopeptidase [Anaerolineae bacterium]|nr:zinc metallopeptidase [Anaerolineae bacterium]
MLTYFIFALPALLLALYAQWKVQSTYSRYSQVPNARRITGQEAARILLRSTGLDHIRLEGTPGTLTDHYDPGKDVLRLSSGVANSPSVAALGIVAHEIGHAVQDATNYSPLRLRAGLVPIVNIGSWLGPIIFFVGLLLAPYTESTTVAWIGLFLFAGTAIFALVTLPVELNASRRAQQLLENYQLANGQELQQTKAVLNAAALTYVAALAQALSTLLYYFFILSGFRRRD